MITTVLIAIIICVLLLIYSAIVGTLLLAQLKKNKIIMEEQKQNEEQTMQTETEGNCKVLQPVGVDQQNEVANEPLRFVIDIPKMADKGEDAPPLLMDLVRSPEPNSVLLGVFDGMGGAGSMKVVLPDGTEKTNAYVGSRTTRQLTEQFFSNQEETDAPVEQQLKIFIQEGLKRKNDELESFAPPIKSKLQSTLHKKLPTTMAVSWYQYRGGHDKLHLTTLWAGDSRCYVLLSQKGLLQLTKDDNGVDDALEALMQSPKMNNTISASNDFRINRRDYEIESPCILFTASDGVFDYFPSPLILEYNMLNTLQLSNTVSEWKGRLQVILDAWKQDDVSMALDLPGFKDFNEVKNAYSFRYGQLKSKYKDMIEKADECTEILLKEKELKTQMVGYRANKDSIDNNIKAIETELEILSQKMGEIQKLIDDYRRQIFQIESQIQSEENNNRKYEGEMEEKKSEKNTQEKKKAPWEAKIAEVEQSLRDLKSDRLIGELRSCSKSSWEDYKTLYEELLKSVLYDVPSESVNKDDIINQEKSDVESKSDELLRK